MKQNASAIAQWSEFERSQLLSEAREALVHSLGFQNSSVAAAAITVKEVQAAFSACAYVVGAEWQVLLLVAAMI